MKQAGTPVIGAMVGALLAFDQLSKLWIQNNVRLQSSVDVIPGFFQLSHFANRGAIGGFGWQSPLTIPLLAIGSVVLAGLIVGLYHHYTRLKQPSWRIKLFAALALTPLIAHTLDRLRQGYVVDFLHFSGLPVFNFADVLPHLAILFLTLEFATLLRSRRPGSSHPEHLRAKANEYGTCPTRCPRQGQHTYLSAETASGEAHGG